MARRTTIESRAEGPCGVCKKHPEIDGEDDWVSCDDCEGWFHFNCAGVDASIKDKDWSCEKCVLENNFKRATEALTASNQEVRDIQREKAEIEHERDTFASEKDQLATEKDKLAAEKDRLELQNAELIKKLDLKIRMTTLPMPQSKIEARKTRSASVLEEFNKALADFEENKSRNGSLYSKSKHSNESVSSVDSQAAAQYHPKNPKPHYPEQSAPAASSGAELATLIKLQGLQPLPKFSGSDKDWPLFLAAYNQSVDEVPMSEGTKLARLEKAIEGSARKLVLGLLSYATKADDVMDELKEEYGRVDQTTKRLTEEILLTPVLPTNNKAALKTFATNLATYTMQLKAMGQSGEIDNNYVLSQLVEKLAKNVSIYSQWTLKKQKAPSLNIADLAKLLREKARTMPSSTQEKSTVEKASESRKSGAKFHNSHQSSKADCGYCGASNSHAIYNCPQFKKLEPAERFRHAKSKHLCFCCLSSEHMAPACDRKRVCGVEGCEHEHSRLLHFPKKANANEAPRLRADAPEYRQDNRRNNNQPESVQLHHQVHQDENVEITAKVVAVRVHGQDGKFWDTYAFLDDGSSVTMMERHICDKLGLSGANEELRLCWTKGMCRTEDALRCDVSLSGANQRKQLTLTNVYCVRGLELTKMSQNGSELASRYRHLRGLPLPNFNNVRPEILIGLEHATLLNGTRIVGGKEREPLASKTRLGWIVYGQQYHPLRGVQATGRHAKQRILNMHSRLSHSKTEENQDRELHELVKGFFAAEAIGVSAPLKCRDEVRMDEVFKKTLKFTDGRYEVGLLWESDDAKLPDSSAMAMKRLVSEERKLRKDPDSLAWMNEHVKQLLVKQYARVATEEDLKSVWPREWICPMFTVVNKNKVPPKRRCVADTAAKVNGVSLNSRLLKGPDNLIALPAALCRAREHRVMVTADVAEMFHQVRIAKEDQQCQRFLWRDGKQEQQPTVYIMQAMMFGPTDSPSKAQEIKNLHAEKYRATRPEASEALRKFMYVDDYFNSHASKEEALRVTTDAVKICAEMGFDLVQVQSNCDEFLSQLPERHVKHESVSLNLDDGSSHTAKILGMHFRPSDDELFFKCANHELVEEMREGLRPTKREALSTLMKVFDPLGLAAKFIVRGKWILQEVWREGIEWDEQIIEELCNKWLEFFQSLIALENVKIPRWYAPVDPRECEVTLITFVDASDKACAAVSYFRFQQEDEVHVALVMAKTKVAPLKPMSIPRLELEAARLGARLAKTIESLHSFKIHRRIFLSDSKCVLAQIGSTAFKFKPFVAHRVGEILELTEPDEWCYVPSAENVADDATKINKSSEDESKSRWFCGSPFMKLDRREWPIESRSDSTEEPAERMVHVHLRNENSVRHHPVNLVKPHFRNSWVRLCNVIARMTRITSKHAEATTIAEYVTAEEFRDAENEVFSVIQRESFEEEWSEMFEWSRSKITEKFDSGELKVKSPLRGMQLSMMPSEKLIRLISRDRHSSRSYAAKNIILLPRHHELVYLYLKYVHAANMHAGIESTIADAREKVWIIGVRQALGNVIANCQQCKNRKAQPICPTFGSLHESRSAFGLKPFSHVGVDCLGPINVKFGRGTVKRWVVLFTCLTYRAVYLELVMDLSMDQMLNAVRSLIARRGKVVRMYSDNGSNFVGSSNKLDRERQERTRELGEAVAREFHLDWRFIPAYSPWIGGAWERLVALVKKVIDFMLNGETMTEDVLRSALIEAELIINKRPITHTPIDPDDDEPLTPNLALFGSSDSPQALGIHEDRDQVSRSCRRRVLHLCEKFRNRWEREYLPIIAASKKSKSQRQVKLGDVVLLAEGFELRNDWKLARVIKIYPSTDGVPRIVDVKLGSGEVKFRRAVGNLALLDV